MGDRGTVVIMDEGNNNNVYLYTHWRGSILPNLVAHALAKRERWDDAPYLARIIFCQMVNGEEKETTGFGITALYCDAEHPVIVVNVPKQTIHEIPPSQIKNRQIPKKLPAGKSFEEWMQSVNSNSEQATV